jgi:hypothetical protein
MQVDRILQAKAVGLAWAEGVGIGVAQHLAVTLAHQPRQALGQHVGATASHLGLVGRVELEGAAAVQHGFGVDRGDGRQVSRGAGAQDQGRLGHVAENRR